MENIIWRAVNYVVGTMQTPLNDIDLHKTCWHAARPGQGKVEVFFKDGTSKYIDEWMI